MQSQLAYGINIVVGGLVCAVFCGPVAAQETGAVKPAIDNKRAPLAGPSVTTSRSQRSLVEIDFPGKVRRVDASPEEAAVRLLELSEDVRRQVDAILTERVKKLDAFVSENLLLLNQLDTAGNTGDKMDQLRLLGEAVHKLAPVWRKGSLKSQLREVLPSETRAEFDRLIEEYWVAIVNERQDLAAPDATEMKTERQKEPSKTSAKAPRATKPTTRSRFEIVTEERLASFGKEIERAFERQLMSGNIIADYVIKAVTMSDEQKVAIRSLCAEFTEKTKQNASEKQTQELFLKIAGVLDTKQQLELARLIQGLKKTKAGRD